MLTHRLMAAHSRTGHRTADLQSGTAICPYGTTRELSRRHASINRRGRAPPIARGGAVRRELVIVLAQRAKCVERNHYFSCAYVMRVFANPIRRAYKRPGSGKIISQTVRSSHAGAIRGVFEICFDV